jgi:MFS family permease
MDSQPIWLAALCALLVGLICLAAERRPDLHPFASVPWHLLFILSLCAALILAILALTGMPWILTGFPRIPPGR